MAQYQKNTFRKIRTVFKEHDYDFHKYFEHTAPFYPPLLHSAGRKAARKPVSESASERERLAFAERGAASLNADNVGDRGRVRSFVQEDDDDDVAEEEEEEEGEGYVAARLYRSSGKHTHSLTTHRTAAALHVASSHMHTHCTHTQTITDAALGIDFLLISRG